MDQMEMLQLILEKLVGVEQRMGSIEQGMDRIEQRMDRIEQRMDRMEQRIDSMETELKSEIHANRQAIFELKTDVEDIKQSLRYYDYKIIEHEKEIFRMKTNSTI